MIILHIEYFAALRELFGLEHQTIQIDHCDAHKTDLALRHEHRFTLSADDLKLAVNNEFVDWIKKLCDGDKLVFIPPASVG